jgi:hypothetical protein
MVVIHESVAYGGNKYIELWCNSKDKDEVIILFLVGFICNCFTMYFEEYLFACRIWDIEYKRKMTIFCYLFTYQFKDYHNT